MKRAEVAARFEELGYRLLREGKHQATYEHAVTGKKVGLAHTPSDPNWYHAALRDAEKGAVTNGSGHLRFASAAAGEDTVAGAARRVLGAAGAPLKVEEVAAAVTKAVGGDLKANTAAVRAALSAASRKKPATALSIVRLKRGWYVYDPELAALPGPARESAVELIAKAGPRRAWREPAFRDEALAFGRGLSGKPAATEPESAPGKTPEIAAQPVTPPAAPERKPRRPAPEPARAPTAPLPAMFELVGEDPSGFAVLRGEDERLWLARPLAAVRFE